MKNITIIAPGSLRERYFRETADEYKRRLAGVCRIHEVEVREERLPQNPSPAEISHALEREAVRIRAEIPQRSFTVALCIEGRLLSSEEFQRTLEDVAVGGLSSAAFIIGSSFGLSEKLKNECDLKLSMSRMTFPHQLARVMLFEAIYRSFEITSGTRYHK